MSRLEQLLARFEDEKATAAEVSELKQLLADSAHRRTMVEYLYTSEMIATFFLEREIADAPLRRLPLPVRRWLTLLAAAAAVLVAAGLFILWTRPGGESLANHTGAVLEKSLADGTHLAIEPGAQLRVAGNDRRRQIRQVIVLESGEVQIRSPKASEGQIACRVQTPDGLWVETIGTTFKVSRSYENEQGERNVDKSKLTGLITAVLAVAVIEGEVKTGNARAAERVAAGQTSVASAAGVVLAAAPAAKQTADSSVYDLRKGALDVTCWAKNPPRYSVINVYGNKVTPGAFSENDGGTLSVGRGDGGPKMTVNLLGGVLSLRSLPWRKGSDFPKEVIPHFDGDIVVHKPSFINNASAEWPVGGALNGTITDGPQGTGLLTVLFDGGMGPLYLNNANNTWSGGLAVMTARVRAGAPGSLGRGPVRVGQETCWSFFYSAALETVADNSLVSPKSVTIEPEGALYLRSNESKPGKVIAIKSGAALINVYGGTAYQFDPARPDQNFSLEKGSLLLGSDGPMGDRWPDPQHWMIRHAKYNRKGPDAWSGGQMPADQLPSYDMVKSRLGEGDGLFGLYDAVPCGEDGESHLYPMRDTKRSPNSPRVFGDDGKENIWRGLGVPTHGVNEYVSTYLYADVANEAPASKQGICLYSQGRSWFKIHGGQKGADDKAAFNVNEPSHPLRLDGCGKFTVSGVPGGNFKRIEKFGAGPLLIWDANALQGKTVNVREGSLHAAVMGVLNGATVNVEPGATLVLASFRQHLNEKWSLISGNGDIYDTTGTVTMKDGSFIFIDEDGSKCLGQLKFAGRSVVNPTKFYGNLDTLPGNDYSKFAALDAVNFDLAVSCIPTPPYSGIARGEPTNAVMRPSFTPIILPAGGVTIGNGCRLTVQSDLGGVQAINLANKGKGITLSPAARVKAARIATMHHLPLSVDCPVNLTAEGTLVIGDKQKFHNHRAEGFASQGVLGVAGDITQDGLIILTNPKNVMGAVRVEAGVLAIGSTALGGAKSIEVSDGGGLQVVTGATLAINGDLILKEGARLIVAISDQYKPETLAGKKIVLATITGKRIGQFASVSAASATYTIDAKAVSYDGDNVLVDGSGIHLK